MAKKKYTAKVLERYKKILVSELKKELNKPGSNLEKSIIGRKLPKRDGFVISMNDYGLNVNQGRSAGKLPPVDKIKDWIIRNDIRPKTFESAKPSALSQLAFLIRRSISQKGIKPTRFIDIVIDKFEPRMTMDLVDAYRREIQEEINAATPSAKKG